MNKTRVHNILELCLWIINPFIIVLVIFDQRIEAGLFFQWLGKLHPLALHFPIVFGILITIYFLFFQKFRLEKDTEKLVLVINALFASIVALFGIFLARQGNYDGEIFELHKWGGIAIAFFSWFLLLMANVNILLKRIIAVLFLVVLIGATHKGAQLTHGVNALSFPERQIPEQSEFITTDSTSTVFETAVLPIFNQKCVSCHGPDKVKGDLRLDTREHILAGGESGDILTAGLTGDPVLIELIHLPEDHDKHMPPEGKLQLTKNELSLLRNWITKENNFDIYLKELSPEDSLVVLVENYLAANRKVEIKTDLPDLAEFNTDYCTVNYLYYGSDEVEVNFFQGSFYNRETLKNLLNIKDQIVRLNMQNMPLKKEDLDIILQFENLQKVNLNSTQLAINEVEEIKVLNNLRSVAICGIKFNENELDNFLADAKFSAINVWADNVNHKQLAKLVAKYPEIEFTIGDNLEDKVLQINTPVIDQDSFIIKTHLDVTMKHLLNGVDIFFTTDGSEPDSLSQKYGTPVRVSENTVLKARAYKKGWLSSDIVQRTFYKSGLTPDTIYLTETPHPKYPGKGAKTLIDHSLGETNISNGEWLGYKDYDMEFTIGFDRVQPLKKIELNALTDIGSHIFPVKSILVQGSNDGKQYSQIVEQTFPDANKNASRQAELFGCALPKNTEFVYYRVTVSNLKKMPSWHQAKGKPAWIFVDEVFLN